MVETHQFVKKAHSKKLDHWEKGLGPQRCIVPQSWLIRCITRKDQISDNTYLYQIRVFFVAFSYVELLHFTCN
jgi:hypothetical protein